MVKKFVAVLLLLFFATQAFMAVPVFADPSVSAASAVLMDASTGEILFQKAAFEQRSMASTTKIMTALLAIESNRLEDEILITDQMARVEGTALGLKPGDKITLNDLVSGMMLESGNDAANATAIALSGSFEEFAKLMNKRAKEIGMQNTNFVTPSGLDDENHYTTAYDMALLAKEALNNPKFYSISSSKNMRISFGNPVKSTVSISNHNRLLKSYQGAIGVKTGFTKKSGRCLVSAAERNGVRLIAVTLKASNDWNDHKTMLDFGFSLAKETECSADLSDFKLNIVGGKATQVSLVSEPKKILYIQTDPSAKIEQKVQLPPFEYAPVKKGDVVGSVVYTYKGQPICRSPITANETSEFLYEEPEEKPFFIGVWDFIKGIF